AELVICRSDDGPLESVPNTKAAVGRWLESLTPACAIAVEATGTYHRLVVDAAYRSGHPVYLLDGYKLNSYREAVGPRAKTDPADASLSRRYLVSERSNLTPRTPPPVACRRRYQLLSRRAVLAQPSDAARQRVPVLPRLKS